MNPKRAPSLPRVSPLAWHGPLGEACIAIAPTTEADPIAILATLLSLYGALIGDGPYVRVGGVRHPPRVWPLVIGKTGSGRKGTSFAEARYFARSWSTYADAYISKRVVSGLSSGEGLLAALGAVAGAHQDEAAAEAVAPDGRLTVVESEFARVLAAAKREGNTLGPILRQLWDDGAAAILTRAAPLSVTGAHVAVIAHVTPRELRLRLAESDLAGGTVNRFLLIASERPHLLAHDITEADVAGLARFLGDAADFARAGVRELRRDRAANDLWTHVYAALCADEPDGSLGAVLARGPAYTMRLALVYALADGAGAISCEHLLAGLAVWHYASETARLVFGASQRSTDIERLRAFLAAAGGGRTRTEVVDLFGRNKSAADLDRMLEDLESKGDVGVDVENAGLGRPVTRYWWTGVARDAVGELLSAHESTKLRNKSEVQVP